MKLIWFFKTLILCLLGFLSYKAFPILKESPTLALFAIIFNISSFYFLLTRKTFYISKIKRKLEERKEAGFDFFLDHPARLLVVYFLGISLLGTVLLFLPISIKAHHIKLVDAFFTSISATCVTGLSTISIVDDLTTFGQVVILILLQFGGLGIMSLACIVLHTVGKIRIRQERFLLLDTDGESAGESLKSSLMLVLSVTFSLEIIGAILLSYFIYLQEGNFLSSLYKGIFISITSFCNAGLSLSNTSLIPYAHNAGVLYVSSFLIILGGFSPLCLTIFSMVRQGKKPPLQFKIAFYTTLILLLIGNLTFVFFEWKNVFSDFSFIDKINNIWFMSASARTAGFNTVNLLEMHDITYLVICFLMFIGGSPGGTAGGIKTTTFAVIFLAFFACIRNRKFIIIDKKEIKYSVVLRAITIFGGAFVILVSIIFMLLATQNLPTRELIFEGVSAFGTTGLSLGITSKLDEIGKIIICIAMFLGRIGTLVSFSLLTEEKFLRESKYPSAKINLT